MSICTRFYKADQANIGSQIQCLLAGFRIILFLYKYDLAPWQRLPDLNSG